MGSNNNDPALLNTIYNSRHVITLDELPADLYGYTPPDTQTDTSTDTQTDTSTDTQTDTQTDTSTDTQTDTSTDTDPVFPGCGDSEGGCGQQ